MSYRSEKDAKELLKINEVLEDMPEFVAEWVQNLRYKKTTSTILNYLYDIKSFLTWVDKDVTPEDLENLKVDDFYQYLDYYHVMIVNKGGKPSLASKKRKLASIRSLYHFLFKTEKIATNRASLIDLPEIQDRSSITLDPAETADLLDNVKYGNHLTPRQQKKHNKYVKRDLALITLLLGTGIRGSECIGINLDDIDQEKNRITIKREGLIEDYVYYDDEVREVLFDYLKNDREKVITDDPALFLSNRKTRINIRTVQNLVKKYAKDVIFSKKISPHTLTKTYDPES